MSAAGASGSAGSGLNKGKAGSNGQAKKLVIKPLKLNPKLPTDFEEASWAKLQDAVAAVHNKRPVACSLEELYRAVEDMCSNRMADRLYARLQPACDAHIRRQLAGLQQQTNLDPVAFLERVDAVWQDYVSQMLTVRGIFMCLDRSYVITSLPGLRSLYDMGLASLRAHLLALPQVEARLLRGLLTLIERERSGEAVDRQLLGRLLRMLQDLGLYTSDFQATFLSETQAFYTAEGDRLMAVNGVPDYLLHCETRLNQELDRCATYLDPATRKPLVAAVEAALISRHLPALLERGFGPLMAHHKVPDLGRLYSLAGRVGGHDALRAAWREYIAATGSRLVKDEEKEKDMVERLLELKSRLDQVLAEAFGRSDAFSASLKDALESAINCRQNKPAELVAKYIDAKLRSGGSKGLGEDELETALDQALSLFRFIQGKDVFEAFYKKDLAKRLLMGKSASIDAEKSMISKLKVECGNQFTTNLEGMFRDMELSKEFMAGFRHMRSSRPSTAGGAAAGAGPAGADGASAGAAPSTSGGGGASTSGGGGASTSGGLGSGVETSISVLTSGFWPTYPVCEVALPEELSSLQQAFSTYYLARQGGRQLVWQHSLGSCLLRASFPKGTKELSVSLFQAVVLMLFNDADSLSFGEIQTQTRVEERELRRTLQSLACGKVRPLRKLPPGREVGDADVFEFNTDFSEKLYRLKINSIQMKETQEENKKTNEQVLQDRQHQIDAAVVRIMKARKTLSHKLLVQEVLTQLSFPLAAADLKKRIESLIERDFLERDKADKALYNYLA